MRDLVTRPRVIILGLILLVSLASIFVNGIEFGIDFKGGTLFQVELDEKVSQTKMETITSIIGERLDAFGLKDTKVNSLGEEFVIAQIAETNPEKIDQLESLLRTQGKFDATINGTLLFEGSDILLVDKDPAKGYGVFESGSQGSWGWQLPFVLSQKAAQNFSQKVFHKCTAVGFDAGSTSYDCESTYFFIDRPSDAVIIVPRNVFSNDSELLSAGSSLSGIPQGSSVEELMENAVTPYLIVDSNGFTVLQLEKLEGFSSEKKKAILHPSIGVSVRTALEGKGFEIVEQEETTGLPWIWSAVGARQVIALTAGIANLQPYVDKPENARVFSELLITGSAESQESGRDELKALQVLLETGSLPIGIKSISKETISPLLGQEFLNSVFWIGILALIVVALVIFVRYRVLNLVLPIVFTGLSEIILILGFASIFKFNLDLAAVAGILAAVGTGVDDQIIITDELLRREIVSGGSFVNRIKKAFFIIFATASTTIATMLPIFIFSFGLGKLRSFAIITIVGVLIGVILTRPVYSMIAEKVLGRVTE